MSFMDRLKAFFGGDDADKQVQGQGEDDDGPPAPQADPAGMPTSDAQEDRPV